ncbi:MAG TPA: hypothetical protein VFD69_14785 [Vicinamibacterales bacterium]|nr:hypothetical protein [Vicinamibacterales bacterium]
MIAHLQSGTSAAQTQGDPNPGAITLTGSMDASNAYLFRGIPQDDTGLILWPAADLGVALRSGAGTVRSITVNVGMWNSLHTGITGSDGPSGKLWYESDFWTSVGVGFAGGVNVAAMYTAYTSPNGAFPSVKELSFKASAPVRGTNPYALVAFELEGQADGGAVEGRYLELGAAPGFSLAGMAVAVPVKVGLSLDGYYEGLRGDERFGFFSIGGSLTVPLSSERSRFGRWNAHGGVDYVRLGDSNALRLGDNTKVIISAGIGLSY